VKYNTRDRIAVEYISDGCTVADDLVAEHLGFSSPHGDSTAGS
jgi:hypothetical protein